MSASPPGAPLPSSADAAAAADDGTEETDEAASESDEESGEDEEEEEAPAKPARPPPPTFKPSSMILTFLFLMGILMLFDESFRNGVAYAIGLGLAPAIGFGGHYVLLTMFLAAVLEMVLTAVAYNYVTDWVKTARIQKWSAAFRKAQMDALKSGKKDRVDALKPFQQEITRLTSEMSINQLKGMAVTWFLVIAIYTWVGIFVACSAAGYAAFSPPNCAASPVVDLGGTAISLLHHEWIVPLWFLIFSLYTIPSSLILRRYLKEFSLRRYRERNPEALAPAAAPTLRA